MWRDIHVTIYLIFLLDQYGLFILFASEDSVCFDILSESTCINDNTIYQFHNPKMFTLKICLNFSYILKLRTSRNCRKSHMSIWNKEASRLYAELLPSRADDMHASGRCVDDVRMTYVVHQWNLTWNLTLVSSAHCLHIICTLSTCRPHEISTPKIFLDK